MKEKTPIEIARSIANDLGLEIGAMNQVKSVGKFERTTLLGVYLYDAMMNGDFGETIDDPSVASRDRFVLTEIEARDFNVLSQDRIVDLVITESGFVYAVPMNG